MDGLQKPGENKPEWPGTAERGLFSRHVEVQFLRLDVFLTFLLPPHMRKRETFYLLFLLLFCFSLVRGFVGGCSDFVDFGGGVYLGILLCASTVQQQLQLSKQAVFSLGRLDF